MDLNHWNKYYKNNKEAFQPSNFTSFAESYFTDEKSIIDIGCGNGRDSLYFLKKNYDLTGIDFSEQAIDYLNFVTNSDNFKTLNILNIQNVLLNQNFDIAYCRFLFHAIDVSSEDILLGWIKSNINSLLCIETRIRDIESVNIQQSHFRREIDEREFIKKIKNHDFKILYREKSRDFSKYKDIYKVDDLNNDPLLLRLICKVNND